MGKRASIVVIAAHSDDQILGPGGTLIKYAREGKTVYAIIFSFGELSHPWIKPIHITKKRILESKKADKIIGGKGVFFLGLKEGKFEEEFVQKRMDKKLAVLLQKLKPEMIFTHASDDPLPDHRAVHRLVLTMYDSIRLACPVYTFDVWTFLNFKDSRHPKLVVDITKTFKTKIKALAVFKSQKMAMLSLLWSVYVRAITNGFKHNKKLAEVFYKVR